MSSREPVTESLIERLLADGALSAEEMRRARSGAAGAGEPLLGALLRAGVLDEDEVVDTLTQRLVANVKKGEADGVSALVIAGDPGSNNGVNFCGQPGSCGCDGLDCGVFHADRLYQFTTMLGQNGYAADLCMGANAVPDAVKTALTSSIDIACQQFEPPA